MRWMFLAYGFIVGRVGPHWSLRVSFDFVTDLFLSNFSFFRFLSYKMNIIILLLILSNIYPEELIRSYNWKHFANCKGYTEVRQSITWSTIQTSVDRANAHRNIFGMRSKVINISPWLQDCWKNLLYKLSVSLLFGLWTSPVMGSSLPNDAFYFVLGNFSLLENPFSSSDGINLSFSELACNSVPGFF